MIASAGHIALILPRFAAPPLRRRDVGIHRYLGDKRWATIPDAERAAFLHIGF
jgi:hypothetical protein